MIVQQFLRTLKGVDSDDSSDDHSGSVVGSGTGAGVAMRSGTGGGSGSGDSESNKSATGTASGSGSDSAAEEVVVADWCADAVSVTYENFGEGFMLTHCQG